MEFAFSVSLSELFELQTEALKVARSRGGRPEVRGQGSEEGI